MNKELELTIGYFIEQKKDELWYILKPLLSIIGTLFLIALLLWTIINYPVILGISYLLFILLMIYYWLHENWKKAKKRARKKIRKSCQNRSKK